MKVWTAEEIIEVLDRNDDQVCKAIVKLYNKQTEDEKQDSATHHRNNVGFNGADAEILSSFARQYQSKGYLSDKQIVMARKKIKKYAKQLCAIANNESAQKWQEEKDEEFKSCIPEKYRALVKKPDNVEYRNGWVVSSYSC